MAWAANSWAADAWFGTAWFDSDVSVTASIAAGPWTEAQIVAGGQTIVITLGNDTFVAFNDTIRQAIIDGMDSAQSEVPGWNNEVRDKEVVGSVVRDSDTQVTITLSASLNYAITANETITITVPASALTGATLLVGSPTVGITNETPLTAVVGGHYAEDERRARKDRDREELRHLIEKAAGLIEEVESIVETIPIKQDSEVPRETFKSQITGLRQELNAIISEKNRFIDLKVSRMAIDGIIKRSVNDLIDQIAGVLRDLAEETIVQAVKEMIE